jgi:hypothetical protein
MTLVAVWRHEPGRIHGIADTRISSGVGDSVFKDHGPKILPLTMVCRHPDTNGFFEKEAFRAEFGFAFAGSTLTALSSHALANILCGHLGGLPALPPSLDEIAATVRTISHEYMKEIGVIGGEKSVFQAILFGHCPRTHEHLAFEFQPTFAQGGFQLVMTKHLLDESTVVIIGTNPGILRERIESIRQQAEHPITYADAPMRALKGLISEGIMQGVGGSVQQAWAFPTKLEIVATAAFIERSEGSNWGLYVLGFDTSQIQNIGHYRVILTGRF